MQAPQLHSRINMHINRSRRAEAPPGSLVLLLLLILIQAICHLVGPSEAWQFGDNHQVFASNRHPEFAYQPAASAAQYLNSQNLYNQPLNSLGAGPQQQFLTPSSSGGQVATQAAAERAPSDQQPALSPAANPFGAIYTPNNRIAQPSTADPLQQQQQVVGSSDSRSHEQSISTRDTSQQQAANPVPFVASEVATTSRRDEQPARASTPAPAAANQRQQDHDVVQSSPSPLGRILDAVARETATALSSIPMSKPQQQQETGTTSKSAAAQKDAKQPPAAATEPKAPHASSESGDKQAPAGERRAASQQTHLQHLKPKKSGDKGSLNSIEQQIINQHARASSYGALNSRRYEPPAQAPPATPAAHMQQLRLLPNKLRGDTKLFSGLLSSLGHNSAHGDSPSSSSSSSSSSWAAAPTSGQPLLSSLVDNFKSGISSRSSIVKAAISDNKLARTLSTVGKTIGGNKYVAGAGAAAALAALGLTVSKFLSPYILAGSYSKLGGATDPLLPSSSLLQPMYAPGSGFGATFASGPDRNFQNFPGASGLGDSMLAASTNQYYEPTLDQFQAALNGQQSQPAVAGATSDTGSFYSYSPQLLRPNSMASPTSSYKPTGGGAGGGNQRNPFDAGANGHYSSYYNSIPNYEPHADGGDPQSGPGASISAEVYDPSGPSQSTPAQQFGSYISGAPSGADSSPGQSQQSQFANYASSPSLPSLEAGGSNPFGGHQVDPSLAGGYETASSPAGQHFDQIVSSASSGTPTYYSAASRVNFPAKSSSSSSGAAGRRVAGAPHRSGAVMLKLDAATRDMLRQQLEAEVARTPLLNYNYLTLGASPAPPGGTDQSSNGDGVATPGEPRPAADSSGNYATFVRMSAADEGLAASNYAPQSTQATAPGQQGRSQFVISGGSQAASGGVGGNDLPQSRNSIRPQTQTRRNERAGGAAGDESAPATNGAHVLIRPSTLAAHWAGQRRQLAGESSSPSPSPSPSGGHPVEQPRLVPIVGFSRPSASPNAAPVFASSQAGAQAKQREQRFELAPWNQVDERPADQKASAIDKKPAVSSLSSTSSSSSSPASPSGRANSANDQVGGGTSASSSLHRASRTPGAAKAQAAVETATGPWQIATLDQQSLIRDYEVLAAQQQQHDQRLALPPAGQPGERPTRPFMAVAPVPPSTATTTASLDKTHEDKNNDNNNSDNHNDNERGSQNHQDELLQVASNMRANLIQLTGQVAGPPAASGAEYQLDGGVELENNPPEGDTREGDRNKLIEAKANTNNAADSGGGGGGESLPSTQREHNQRHRSQPAARLRQDNQPSAGDNVGREQLSPPATAADQSPPAAVSPAAHKQTQVAGESAKLRAFRGVVAGGIVGSGGATV